MISRKKIWMVAIVLILAVAAIILFKRPNRQLLLVDDESGQIYANYPLEENGVFSVTFKHSVNQSDATDVYEIQNGKIIAVRTRYSTFGAGMPTDIPPGQRIEYDSDGYMVIHDINMEIDRLCYVVGTVYDHFLEINGESINLTELCGRNRAVKIQYIT